VVVGEARVALLHLLADEELDAGIARVDLAVRFDDGDVLRCGRLRRDRHDQRRRHGRQATGETPARPRRIYVFHALLPECVASDDWRTRGAASRSYRCAAASPTNAVPRRSRACSAVPADLERTSGTALTC